jgi:hypothetical protein
MAHRSSTPGAQPAEHVLDHVNTGFPPVNVHLAAFLAPFS